MQPQKATSSSVITPNLPGQPATSVLNGGNNKEGNLPGQHATSVLNGGNNKEENLPGQPATNVEEKANNEGHLSHDIGEADEGDHENGAEQGNEDDIDVGADNEKEV